MGRRRFWHRLSSLPDTSFEQSETSQIGNISESFVCLVLMRWMEDENAVSGHNVHMTRQLLLGGKRYNLCSVVVQRGNAHDGHYWSICRHTVTHEMYIFIASIDCCSLQQHWYMSYSWPFYCHTTVIVPHLWLSIANVLKCQSITSYLGCCFPKTCSRSLAYYSHVSLPMMWLVHNFWGTRSQRLNGAVGQGFPCESNGVCWTERPT